MLNIQIQPLGGGGEDHKFTTSLGCMARSYLKKKKKILEARIADEAA
jgi:hypothetical protein